MDYRLFLSYFLISVSSLFAQQTTFTGVVKNSQTNTPLQSVEVYDKTRVKTFYTDARGVFQIPCESLPSLDLVFIGLGYEILENTYNCDGEQHEVLLKPISEQLSEVLISSQKKQIAAIKRLKDVEGTAIYAGKKSEVVLLDQMLVNKASGNARQAYAQVAGLNIYEGDDAGLQLNIGGRGLDPNRSSNFNTRQNGYDISADVLGYPESYYTPPLEAIEEIQIVRGAASLQYGTQFGGLVNFKMKSAPKTKDFEAIARVGAGSFGLQNYFLSLGGNADKISYYSYVQLKSADGFRENSNFDSRNIYGKLSYAFTDKTQLHFESTYLNYTAQQPGGLTDLQFALDPTFSNRTRNYFKVDWLLLNLKLEHEFAARKKLSLNIFTLDAYRKAVGFRDTRASTTDVTTLPRELLTDSFNNWGAELRFLMPYRVFGKKATLLLGSKYYQSYNESQQGIGSAGSDANFTLQNQNFPNSGMPESAFDFPNLNVSVFGEQIFKLSSSFSVTPGFRLEYINTQADGFYINKSVDNAGNVFSREQTDEFRENERSFYLFGLGMSYKPSKAFELFVNGSQNYRSVTFTDIRVISPNLLVDENITDEKGYTADIGVRGTIDDILRYDCSVFSLLYDNRIGLTDVAGKPFRTNVGAAQIFGLESLFTLSASNWLLTDHPHWHWQHFLNTALTRSEFTKKNINTTSQDLVIGNKVEFVPEINFKTGIELGYKNLKTSVQYSYISSQFTDAYNTPAGNTFSTRGEIPAYQVLDFSAEYQFEKRLKNWRLEAGVNNLLDESYFTRRATGYPGPGIIPSNPRNFYVVLQYAL